MIQMPTEQNITQAITHAAIKAMKAAIIAVREKVPLKPEEHCMQHHDGVDHH